MHGLDDHGRRLRCQGFFLSGKPWGVEDLTVAERHYKLLMAGVDQFGGNNEIEPVLEAYKLGFANTVKPICGNVRAIGRPVAENMFRLGLFENPYLDPQESVKLVGNPEYMREGYEAQLKSIVMLKNKNGVLPLRAKSKVYIPKRFLPPGKTGSAIRRRRATIIRPTWRSSRNISK